VVRVVTTKSEPIDEITATPMIEQFLLGRRSHEVVADELKRLKAQARIEILGEFAAGTAAEASAGGAWRALRETQWPALNFRQVRAQE
jgi:hypothetical protein